MKKYSAHQIVYAAALTLATAGAGLAVTISFDHIVDLARTYGVSNAQSIAAPFFVDGIMLLGRLGQARFFDDITRRIGKGFMLVGALLSLSANMLAGHTPGQRVWGAMVVFGFLACEFYASRMGRAATKDELHAQQVAQRRSNGAKAAALTRKANAAASIQPTPKSRHRKLTAV